MAEDFEVEVRPGSESAHQVRLRVMEFAELYPDIPLRSVARCLWEADQEAEFAASNGERRLVSARLVTARLDEIKAADNGGDERRGK